MQSGEKKWIIVARTALSATLQFGGLFLLAVGVWTILYDPTARGLYIGLVSVYFGGSITAVAIMMMLELIEVSIALSAILFFFGSFLFLAGVDGLFYGSKYALWLGILMMCFGSLIMAVGIKVMLELRAPKEERMDAYAPKDTYTSLIPKGRFCKQCGKLVSVELGSCPNCGKELE